MWNWESHHQDIMWKLPQTLMHIMVTFVMGISTVWRRLACLIGYPSFVTRSYNISPFVTCQKRIGKSFHVYIVFGL